MSVCLCDTNTARDIHINDTLVSQGLALFSPDTNGDEACYDAFQLEPLPQGVSSTAEYNTVQYYRLLYNTAEYCIIQQNTIQYYGDTAFIIIKSNDNVSRQIL